MTPEDAYKVILLALCVWREARGEIVAAKYAVAFSIRNRVLHPSWWGDSWESVILKPFQYSSFNAKDPNAVKFPVPADTSWQASVAAALAAFNSTCPDPTEGSTHYFDRSLDASPPEWTVEMIHVIDIGNLRFFRRPQTSKPLEHA